MTQGAACHSRRSVLRALVAPVVSSIALWERTPAGAQSATRVPILTYHNIDHSGEAYATTPELLAAECQWLIDNGRTAITVYQLWDAIAHGAALPAHPVMLCNDDGWGSALTFAQILGAHGMAGNYFINNSSPLSAADILTLAANGPVQAHTAHHQMMSHLDTAAQRAEIADNRAYISGITGQPVHFLAWPFGDFNASAVQAAKDDGILAAFGLGGAPCYVGTHDNFAIPRIMIEAVDTLETFAAKVSYW